MGGLCSTSYNASSKAANVKYYKSNRQQSDLTRPSQPQVHESVEKQLQEPNKAVLMNTAQYPDDFYDGIPQFNRPMPQKSRSVRSIAKVSEVSSRIGRVGTLGLGKAVEVLDIVGSGMTNLNPSSGFSGVVTKGNELSILAFEVANTIVKGSNLMQSLSKRSVRHLKEEVLLSEGVQNLVSKDMDELLRIVAADKREELKIFSGEVVRFGNRCKDPHMHNLNRYFDKISRELTCQNGLKEEVETVIEQLMTLVQYTAELYHELQVLDRFEQDYIRKSHEEDNSVATQKSDSLTILKAELKSQRKQVKIFKKKSLWSRSLEQVMEKLVDMVHFLLLEIHNAFGSSSDGHLPTKGSVGNHQRLGPAGLALHYANIVMQIDTLVARSSSMPPNTRDALYQSLPPSIKSALHSKLQSFHVKEELTVTEIKAEMEKTLQWLVPIATNTAKAHHGFGWVGEWANTRSEANRKLAGGPTDVIRIETLHHADKERTEAYILEQVLWLHYLVSQSKTIAKSGGMRSPIKSPICTTLQKTNQQPKYGSSSATSLTIEDQLILQDVSKKRRIPGISKSQDFDFEKTRLRMHDRLSKSSSHSPTRVSKESVTAKRLPSGAPVISFGMEKKKALDVIDRVCFHNLQNDMHNP